MTPLVELFGSLFIISIMGITLLLGVLVGYVAPDVAALISVVGLILLFVLPDFRKWLRSPLPQGYRKLTHIFGGILIVLFNTIWAMRTITTILIALLSPLIAYECLHCFLGMKLPVLSKFLVTLGRDSKSESTPFMPAIYWLLSVILTLTFFESPIANAAVLILAFGDSIAAVTGMTIGKTRNPINQWKTVEGSLLGLFSAFIGATLYVPPMIALLGATSGMFVEALPLPVDDNLTIPLTSAIAMALASSSLGLRYQWFLLP